MPHIICPSCKEDFGTSLENESKWLYGHWPQCVAKNKFYDYMKAEPKEGNGKYQGPFAFTLTKSPTDTLTIDDMIKAVRKVMKQTSFPVIKYAWYYEDKGKDDNGNPLHPHIHGMYETIDGKRIESRHFKRAWPIWDPSQPQGQGFRGGYHRPVAHNEAYSDYIKKDAGLQTQSEVMGIDNI